MSHPPPYTPEANNCAERIFAIISNHLRKTLGTYSQEELYNLDLSHIKELVEVRLREFNRDNLSGVFKCHMPWMLSQLKEIVGPLPEGDGAENDPKTDAQAKAQRVL